MKQLNLMNHSFVIFFMLFHSACGYSANADKNEPIQQKSSNAIGCPEVGELIDIIGRKNIYSQTPEEFFQSAASLIKPIKDNTTQATSQLDREIDFSQINNNWLLSAHSAYGIHSKKIFFGRAEFQFSPSCFKAPADFINMTKSKIGKGYKDLTFPPPDDAIKVYSWHWKDPDINKIRLMQVTASSTIYEIKVIIDPAPTNP
ncbi:MAG: hypothetical protein RL497_600 [Pseudomonadota bacterium]|jgi:hypothetical protein